MRLFKTIFTFTFVMLCVCQFANAQRGGSTPATWFDHNPTSGFWVDVGGSVFDRPGVDNAAPVLLDTVTNEVFLTLGDISDLQTSFGANIAFGGNNRNFGMWDAEATIVNWDATTTVAGDNLIAPLFGFTTPDSVTIEANSDLASIEFNRKRQLTRGLTVLAGPRYFRLEDNVIFSTDTGTFNTTNDTLTTNSMIGAQIGAELKTQVSQVISLRTHGKLAGFANRIEFSDAFSDSAGATTFTESDETVGAFIGEVGGRVVMDIVPGAFQSYVGYEATWLGLGNEGDFAGSGTGDSSDAIFYHQIMFGCTFSR